MMIISHHQIYSLSLKHNSWKDLLGYPILVCIAGKGVNIWDVFLHSRPSLDNGDVACDSYHKWQEDVDLMKQLNVSHDFFLGRPFVYEIQ